MAEKDLAQNAVERLSEDERLRGDLSDIGFGPLLDWATNAITAFAEHATDEDAVEKYADRVRGVVQTTVSDADAGKIENVTDLLDFDPADKAGTEAALKALKLGDDSDQNAVDLAGVLQAALKPATSSETPKAETPETPAEKPAEQEKTKKAESAHHYEVPTMTNSEPKSHSESTHTKKS